MCGKVNKFLTAYGLTTPFSEIEIDCVLKSRISEPENAPSVLPTSIAIYDSRMHRECYKKKGKIELTKEYMGEQTIICTQSSPTGEQYLYWDKEKHIFYRIMTRIGTPD